MSADELPPLPKELAEEMAAFRRKGPSDELVLRSLSALPAQKIDAPRGSFPRIFAFRVAPILAIAAAFVFLVFGRGKLLTDFDFDVSSERAVLLPETGHTWTELDLQTQRHADRPTMIHVEVPTHVSVRFSNENGQPLERSCTEARCVHRFLHHSKNGMPLRVAVAHPGRYEIHVRHESDNARLRERIVLHAKR